jgi:hypothetical protein
MTNLISQDHSAARMSTGVAFRATFDSRVQLSRDSIGRRRW